jgi:hypothetical protein
MTERDLINPKPELPDDTHIPCRVIWRQQDRIGVAFD